MSDEYTGKTLLSTGTANELMTRLSIYYCQRHADPQSDCVYCLTGRDIRDAEAEIARLTAEVERMQAVVDAARRIVTAFGDEPKPGCCDQCDLVLAFRALDGEEVEDE